MDLRRALALSTALSAVVAVTTASALLGAVAGCGSSAPVQTCGEIPDGGCPLGRGGSCEDASCTALYDCVDGAWTEVEACDAIATSSTTTAATGGGGGGGGCEAPVLDRTGEVDGCTPDLLDPDCPVAAAEVCDPCSTGCADFFLCTAEGWIDVAACDEDGRFRPQSGSALRRPAPSRPSSELRSDDGRVRFQVFR